jgi:CRP-like cAMP-binding protein
MSNLPRPSSSPGSTGPVDSRPRNRLLRGLPDDEFARLRPHLHNTAVPVKHVFHQIGEPIRHVIFPNGGVASITAVMEDGDMVETATVGDEGLVGWEVFLGAEHATGTAMLQVGDGNVELLPVPVFKAEMLARGALFDAVQRYSQAVMTLMMQSAACMALHELPQRCCRWLLMTHDRVHGDTFHLSHEFLAIMLGATRPTVTVVAGTLQKAGLIAYHRGRMNILDRKGLEAASCECYATVREHFERLQL